MTITRLDGWTLTTGLMVSYLDNWSHIFNVEYTGREVSTMHYLYVHFSKYSIVNPLYLMAFNYVAIFLL